MNSICSNQSKGWICVRVQHLEKVYERNSSSNKKKNSSTNKTSNWCSGADDWGDDNGFDKYINSNQKQLAVQQQPLDDNLNEQNGNNLMFNHVIFARNENRNMSDDEDEDNSMDDPIPMFGNLQVIDDRNANCGAQGMLGIKF